MVQGSVSSGGHWTTVPRVHLHHPGRDAPNASNTRIYSYEYIHITSLKKAHLGLLQASFCLGKNQQKKETPNVLEVRCIGQPNLPLGTSARADDQAQNLAPHEPILITFGGRGSVEKPKKPEAGVIKRFLIKARQAFASR